MDYQTQRHIVFLDEKCVKLRSNIKRLFLDEDSRSSINPIISKVGVSSDSGVIETGSALNSLTLDDHHWDMLQCNQNQPEHRDVVLPASTAIKIWVKFEKSHVIKNSKCK